MGVFKLLKEPLTKGCRYTVTDENGKVINERTSKRDYVACTANGEYYFLRNDFFLDRKEIDTIKKTAKRHGLYVCASYVNGCCRILVEKPTDKRYK